MYDKSSCLGMSQDTAQFIKIVSLLIVDVSCKDHIHLSLIPSTKTEKISNIR